MDKRHSPISWYGGKGMMTAKLLPLVPEHRIYVEAFGGGASLLFAKPPSPIEVYNDLNEGLVNFFRVLRDPEKAARLHMLASSTPFSREEYCECRDHWHESDTDVERAHKWFVAARMAFSGNFGTGWARAINSSTRGMSQSVSRWNSAHEILGWAHGRLMRVQVENIDFRKLLPIYDTADTLFYLDPPYVLSTRRCKAYQHEMSDADHRDLIELVLTLKGKVLLSGYESYLYKPLMKSGWRRTSFEVHCNAVGRNKNAGTTHEGGLSDHKRTECVWISPGAKAVRRVGPAAKPAPPIHALCFAA